MTIVLSENEKREEMWDLALQKERDGLKAEDLGFQVINGTSPIDIRHWMQTNSAYSTKVALLATRVLIEYRKISRNSQRPTMYKRCINFDSPRRRYSE